MATTHPEIEMESPGCDGVSRREATVMEMAQAVAESRAVPECRNPAAAAVRIMAGREMGIGPMAAVTGIRINAGKVSIDAALMAACIRRSPRYGYRIVEHTAEVCRLEFHCAGELLGESVFSIQDAAKAGLTKNATWQQYPRNMLFSRALSNGARWHCPDIFGGRAYVHEELGLPVDEDGAALAGDDNGNGLCTREQRGDIRELLKAVGLMESELTDKIGVAMLDELSEWEAAKWIRKLTKKAENTPREGADSGTDAAAGQAAQPKDEPRPPADGAVAAPPAAVTPISPEVIREATAEAKLPSDTAQHMRILELAEALEPDMAACHALLAVALEKRGCDKLSQLNHLAAAALIETLGGLVAGVPPFRPKLDAMGWWPENLQPLVGKYGGVRVQATGLRVFGFPPDVFGVSSDQLRQLSAAFENPTDTKKEN